MTTAHKALAFIRRDFQTQASYRLSFLMRIAGMLISVCIFCFISEILGSAVNPYLQHYGADYFHFALVGVAFHPFISLSINSIAEAIHEYQHTGTLEVLFLSPTPILAALIMSNLCNYAWTLGESLFYLGPATLLFHARLEWGSVLSAVLIILFVIAANAGLALINASFVLVAKRQSPLTRLLGLATNLLAGVYYPIEVLPNWLRSLGRLLPATYSLHALRRSMLQGATLPDVGPDLLALVRFTAVLLPTDLITFRYAARWAKTDGGLSQY